VAAFTSNNLLVMGALEVILSCISLVAFQATDNVLVIIGIITIFTIILFYFSIKAALGVKKFEL
jgi:hypothetical protein